MLLDVDREEPAEVARPVRDATTRQPAGQGHDVGSWPTPYRGSTLHMAPQGDVPP
ncbi:hypothetical protein ACIHFC_24575 [Streptomyces sp. NPDC052013]|uniref:hypothetical protein n=1 Tax=Streptomyces sp. NPDC052013 TaxID=3365679 RepID=UPI0037D43092